MSKIISLKARNYQRLVAVEITPEGNVVTINGKNGAGKSSVLDSITAALGGVNKRDIPKPIRDGEDSAEIALETDELIAEMATENDYQVWVEQVGGGDGTGIVIEDGEVVNE